MSKISSGFRRIYKPILLINLIFIIALQTNGQEVAVDLGESIISEENTLQTTAATNWSHTYNLPDETELVLITAHNQGIALNTITFGGVTPDLIVSYVSEWPQTYIYAIRKDDLPTLDQNYDLVINWAEAWTGATSFTALKNVHPDVQDNLGSILSTSNYIASGTSVSTSISPTNDYSLIFDVVTAREGGANFSQHSSQMRQFYGLFLDPRGAGASYKVLDNAGSTEMSWAGGSGNSRIVHLLASIPMVPQPIVTYYSYQNGNWEDASTWTTDPSGTLSIGSAVPSYIDRVVILNGRTVKATAEGKTVDIVEIQDGGILDMGNFTNSTFNVLRGKGILRHSSNQLPVGDISEFVASTGGTVEYYGDPSANFNFDRTTFNNLILNFSNATRVAIAANNFTVNGNLTIQSGDFRIGNSTTNRNVYLNGDVTVEANGKISVGNFNNTGHNIYIKGDLTNNGGNVRFRNNESFTYTSDPTNGRSTVYFNNPTAHQTLTCNGVTYFHNFVVDKGTDATYILDVQASSVDNFKVLGRNDGAVQNADDPGNVNNNKAININAGTLKLGSNILVPRLLSVDVNNTYFAIDLDAALWLDGAEVHVTDQSNTSSLIVYGKLYVTGNSTLTSTGRQGIILRSSGTYEQTGGTVTSTAFRTSSRLDFGVHRGTFIMSGGDLNITGNNSADTHPAFTLPFPDNTFNMSGGTINVLASTYENGDDLSYHSWLISANSSNISVTGGTVNIFANTREARINSNTPFYNLNIEGNGSHNVSISGNDAQTDWGTTVVPATDPMPLVVKNNLSISDGVTFIPNDQNVTIGGNFTIDTDATYTPGSNTTTFNGSAGQALYNSGTITSGLYNVSVENSAILEVNNNLTIRNNLSIGSGSTIQDIGNTVTVLGDLTNDGTHESQASGSITLGGDAQQNIFGNSNGVFGNLSINNSAAKVFAQTKISLTGNLRLASVLNIDTYPFLLSESSRIYDALAGTSTVNFSNTNMVETNGQQSDGGITIAYSSTNERIFPIGSNGVYSPARLQFTQEPTTWGSVTISLAKFRHTLAGANAIQRFWKLTNSGFVDLPTTGMVLSLVYDNSDIGTTAPADLLPAVYKPYTWTSTGEDKVIEANNTIVFDTHPEPEGEFTAGTAADFPELIVFTSVNSGNYDDGDTWNTGEVPGAANPVVIKTDHTVTITRNGELAGNMEIEAGGVLDVGTFTGHNFGAAFRGSIVGYGLMRISSATATAEFPDGDFGEFLSQGGGSVEYYTSGTNFTLPVTNVSGNSISSYNNILLSPSVGETITLPNSDITVHNNLTVNNDGEVYLNSASTKNLTVNGNVLVSKGFLRFYNNNAQTLKVYGDITISSGATLNVLNSYTAVDNTLELYGHMINNGTLNLQPDATRYANVYFLGTAEQTLSGNGATTKFNRIYVDKGAVGDNPLNVTSTNFVINTALSNALSIDNGTICFNGPISDISTTTLFNIPETGCLSVAGGTITMGKNDVADADVLLAGKIEVTGGTLNIGTSGNAEANDIEIAGAGKPQLAVSGGTLNVFGQIRRSITVTSGALDFTQSDGDINIHGQGREVTRALFEVLNSGSNFDVSGGTINLINGGGTTFGDIYLDAGNHSVTGGTITFGASATNESTNSFSLYLANPVWNLTVDGTTNAKTATLKTFPATISNNLSINGSLASEFNASNLQLNIGGVMQSTSSATSSFQTSDSQITRFFGSTQGGIVSNGSNPIEFQNLEIDKTNLSDEVEVSGSKVTRVNGDLTITEGTLVAQSDVELLGNVHMYSNFASNGGKVSFKASEQQFIYGVNDVEFGSVEIDNATGVVSDISFIINGDLEFTNGYLDIGDNNVAFSTTGTALNFSDTKYIITNGALSDRGVTKAFNGTDPFIFPIGVAGSYNPAEYDVNAAGSITVKPVNVRHPATQDPQNDELQYYWNVQSSSFAGSPTITHKYYYDQSQVSGTESSYQPGRYFNYEWVVNTGSVDDGNNWITHTSVSYIDGEYTAGLADNFTNKDILYSIVDGGDWFDGATWSTTPSGSACSCTPDGNPVVIQADHTVTLGSNGAYAYSVDIESGATLAVGQTREHSLGHVIGDGTIMITSTTEGSFIFPGGNFDNFMGNPNSTVQYNGTGTLPASITTYQNISFTGNATTKYIPAVNLAINGNLTIDDGYLDNTNYNRSITIAGYWLSNVSGGFKAGRGMVTFIGGESTINSTGGETFYNLKVNSSTGGISLASPLEVDRYLYLTEGLISTTATNLLTLNWSSANAIVGGSENSYIDGPLAKNIGAGSSSYFPLGNSNRYASTRVFETTQTAYWTVQYYNSVPSNREELELPLQLVSNNEYWIIKPNVASNANVLLRWDLDSYQIPITELGRQKLRVAQYNNSTSKWTGLPTQVNSASQAIQSTSRVEFNGTSTEQFTIGLDQTATAKIVSANTSICDDGNAAQVTVEFTGDGPWDLTYTINGGNQTTITLVSSTSNILFEYGRLFDIDGVGDYTIALHSVFDRNNQEGVALNGDVVITVKSTPNPSISGPDRVRIEDVSTYSVAETDPATYEWAWTVDGLYSSISGADTPNFEITWGASAGVTEVSVTVTNTDTGCSRTVSYTVNVRDWPLIEGDFEVFATDEKVYTTTLNATHTYKWEVVGGTIQGADDSNSVTVIWGNDILGTIKVTETSGGDSSIDSKEVTINKIPVTVTANAGQSKVYGSADPAFTYTVTGGDDNFTGALSRVAGEAVGSYAIEQGTLANPSYSITFVPNDFEITPKELTIGGSFTVHNKTYNQELNASIDGNSLTLVGVEGADNVQLANVVVEFATNTVATGKLVSIVSAELAGDDANNYTLNTSGAPTSTANITPATLTLSDFVAGDKEYDGTTAVLPGHGFSDNRYSGDNLSFTYDVEFENKNVGIGKDVNFINIAIGGTHAGNYTLASETGTANANITARPITITADDKTKVYGSNDPVFTFGITSGSLATGDALSGSPSRDAGEDVDGGPYAITQGTVSVSDDNSGNNYSIAFENGQLTITKRDLTITPKSLKKVEGVEYTPDGTEFTTSSIYYGDVIASVMLTSTGFSSAAEVGYYNITASNAVAQTGTDLNNYTISYADGTNSLEVTAKQPVTLPNIVASNKVYSGNTTATISSWGSLSGVADGDDVSIDVSTYAATFADRHVGNSKNITIANVLLTGAQAYKYYLEAPTAQANITPANLTLNTFTASNKTYDATTTVTSYSVGGHTLLNAGDEVSFSYTVAFEDKNAGADKTVNFSAITLGGAQASNYNLVTTEGIAIATISKATLTLNNFTAGDKVYDGERSVTGDGFADDRFVIEGTPDDLEFTYSVAFNNKHVGENKPVNYTDIVISGGADKDNYVLASNEGSTTANITETLLTINVDAGQTKVYGGTEPTPYTYGAEGLQGTDDMSGALTRTAGENVGTYAILIGDLVPNDGNSGNNYTVSFNSQNFEITRRPLTLSNFRAEGKVYDQTTDVTGTGFDVNNLLSGDEVIITHSAAFDDKHAGISKPVTFTGIEISGGAQADNYTLETLTGTAYATITQKPLVLSSFSAADKVYDGNTIVSGTGFNNNSYSGDDLDFDYTAVFENEHVGEDKPVNYTGITISGGDDQGNYYLSDNTGTAWANIAPAPLTITVTPGQTKVYGASDPVSFTYTTSGLMVGDGMIGSLSRATGNNVGEYAIAQNTLKADDGNDGNNYSVTFVPANFSITPRALTITAKDILKAQGTEYVFNNADFETTPSPLYYSDAITSVDFACAGAATDAIPGTYAITPSNAVGTGLGNYSISYENGTLTVAENKPLTLSDIVADDKIYDGNTTASISSYGTLSDVVPEHPDVSLVTTAASASFSSKNVGASRTVTITGLSLTGSDADFYIIGNQTTNAAITARDLTLDNFVAGSKIYDGNTNVDGDGFEDDRVGSDELTFSYDVAFTDKNVADGKTVNFNNITISGGADQNNYNLVTLSGTAIADITVRTLELSGLKADNKTYDGNTDVGGAGFSDNRVSGDDLEFSYTADFADKNVANGIAVNYTGISISGGVDKDNYVLDSDEGSTTANITRRDLTLSNFTADGKVYDGNANVLSGLNFTDNRVAGDVLEFSHTATFNNENVGVDKTVNHSISLTGGASAGNYTLVTTTAQTQADITARTLNIDFTASDKTYNATTDVTINATDDRVGGDELGISYTAAFDTRHAGVNKDVNITGITLTGVDKDNYATASEVTVKATINTRPIILTANNSSKTYGAADPAEFSYNINSGNLVGDDTFTGALDRATGEDVGTYAIERGSLAISDENGGNNYDLTFNNGTFTISQKAITITVTSGQTKVYGNDDPVLAYTITSGSLLDGHTFSGALARAVGINVGSYAINRGSLTILDGSSADVWDNYAVTWEWASLSITKRPITVTADPQTKVYGDDDPALTHQITSGSLAYSDVLSGSLSRVTGKDVGSYAINRGTLTIVDGSSANVEANYTLTYESSNLSITVRTLTLENFNADSKVYDGFTTATVTGTPFDDDRVTGDDLEFTYTTNFSDIHIGTNKDVDYTSIAISGGADKNNYTLASTTGTAKANISAKALTITAKDQIIPVGTSYVFDVNNDFEVDGLVNNGTDEVTSVSFDDSGVDYNVAAVYTDDIVPSNAVGTNLTNYTITYVNGDMDVTDLIQLSLSGLAAADKTYDGNRTATITSWGTIQGKTDDTHDVSVQTDPLPTIRFGDKSVDNNKTVTVSNIVLVGADAHHYFMPAQTTTANITQRDLELTGFTAQSKTFDGITDVSGEDFNDNRIADDVLTFSYTVEFEDRNSGVDKDVNFTDIAISGEADSGNYNLVTTTGVANASITPKELRLVAEEKSKQYGSDDPELTYTIHPDYGLVPTDDQSIITGAITRDSGEEVGGTYRVTQGTIAATNYNISFITAPFTITPRTLTLNSFSANSKVYDGTTSVPISQFTDDRIADELLEFDYDVVFEDVNVGVDKVVSFSNISISGGSHKDNYTLATTEGETNADITPKALSIFATPQSKVYGSALANASGYTEFTTQGLVNGESVASVSVNYADGNAADDAVGLYPDAIEIASAQPGTFNPSNYNITYVPGDLTVTFTETPENPHTINFGVDGGNGTISATVNGVPILSGTEVDEGQTVIFTATPAPGYVVSGWSQTSSTIEHTALTHTLSVTEDVTVNVSFAAQEANTSIVRFGVNGGNGTITASVDGTEIFDGNAVANGSTVIFTAQPDAGYVVDEWTQTGVTVEHTSIYHSVTVASDVAVSVSFAAQEANTSIVRFSVDGGNGTISASVNGAEIFDGNAVDNGSTVIFQAAPSANYVVDEWTQTGATVEHTSIYHSVTVASDVAVSVSFTAQEANTSIVRFSVNGGNGTLTATVNGIEIYDGNAVANGSTVIFQAAPSDGYVVDEWTQTGATVEHTSIYHSVTVASDVAVSVLFAAQEANTSIVRFSVNGGNGALTASVNGTEIFDGNAVANGSEVVFTAYPNDGYTIQSWVLNGSELNHLSNEYTCTVNEDISLTVAFAQQPEGTYIVNYSVISGSGSLVAKVNGEEILNGAAVEEDQEVIFMATPSEGYRLDEWIVNGSLLEHTELAYNHILNADVSVEVVFKDYGSTSIVANDDAAGTEYETPVTLNVLANDTELENEPIAVTIRTEPVSGTAIVNEDNSVTFSPANGFEGEATFTYTVTDAQGDSDWATVTITVLEDGATNHLPVTVSDSCATSYNTPVTIDVLYNDSGLEDEPITLTINSDIDVLEGTAAVDENNMVLFTPQTDFTGVVIFDYKVEDVHGDYSIASVKVNVKAGENFVPLANDDMVETKFNTSVEIDVLLNDLNLEDKPLALQIIENPTEGEAQINHDNNTIVYTPATDFVGEVLFEYMVVDVDGDWDSAQVSVTVTEVLNVTPVAYADSCGTSFNMPVTIDVLGNDINLNNAPITVTIVSDLDAFVGTAAVGDDNMVEFSPAEDFAGTANFTYRVTDIDGDYDEALVKVTVKEGNNFVPIAYDDSRGTSYNTPVKVDVLKNDINLNDEPIAVIVTEQSIPEQGNAVVNDDGTVEFTPATDYVGQATFTYRVIDIDGDYDDALVTITVKEGENFIPEAIDDVAFTHLQTPVEIDVLANDKHLDDTPVELYADAGQVENGTVEVLSNNSIRFIPADAFVGEASFTYRVTDAEGDFSEANVTIWVYAQVLAVDDEAELMRNDMVTIDVLANDKGLEEITPEISFSLLPVHGMVSVDSDNKLTYTPDYNYFGNDSLTYQVCSQYGSCSEAKVLINVKIEKFRIPEGFSPDGDGINDQFEILGLEVYQQVKIKIFNRWGHVVYQNADYKNNWDGKANAVMSIGKTLPNGTYFYVIEVVDTDERFSGNIFLKR